MTLSKAVSVGLIKRGAQLQFLRRGPETYRAEQKRD